MRIKYLDVARGMAMMMVIVGHIIQPEIMGNTLRYYLFAVHLPLFLIISGILFKEKDYRIIFRKNVNQLLLPYLLGIGLIVIVFLIGYYQPFIAIWHEIVVENLNSIPSILMAAFLVNGGDYYSFIPHFTTTIGAIWYLIGYFEASILFNFILKTVKTKWGQVGTIMILTIIGYGIGSFTALPFQILSSFVMLPFLGVGFYTKKYWLDTDIRNLKLEGLLILVGILLWCLSAEKGILLLVSAQATQGILLGILGGVMGSFSILIIIRWLVSKQFVKPLLPSLVNIGKVSLLMLLVHTLDLRVLPVSTISMRLMGRFIKNEILINYLAMIIAIVFAYCGALILNWMNQRILNRQR